ncbi:MAG TPA: lipoyl(octanoyl) transferase LipB [Armatimonadota bacterium]|nr:lipoyl(octanoyl) transferase LipB [Armatimonadota bacterium]
MRELWFADLGLIGYPECFELQRKLAALRLAGEIEDTLLLLEHTPVVTLGAAGGEGSLRVEPEALERQGIALFHTDRGGNATYHGPGQLVGYPIFDLRSHGRDVHLFIRNLERAVVDCLADFGVAGEVMPGYTGVWVSGEKICSIGIAVRRWITYHGFALNVSPNFEHWSLIDPCGLTGRQVTSLERLIGRCPDMGEVKGSVVAKLARVFDLEPVRTDVADILASARVGS